MFSKPSEDTDRAEFVARIRATFDPTAFTARLEGLGSVFLVPARARHRELKLSRAGLRHSRAAAPAPVAVPCIFVPPPFFWAVAKRS